MAEGGVYCLELGPDDAVGIHDEDPRLGGQSPFAHGVNQTVRWGVRPIDQVRVFEDLDVYEVGPAFISFT